MLVGVCGSRRIDRSMLAEVLFAEPDVTGVLAKRTAANLALACSETPFDVIVVLESGTSSRTTAEVLDRFSGTHTVRVGDGPADPPVPRVSAEMLTSLSLNELLRVVRSIGSDPPRVAVLAGDGPVPQDRPAALTDRELQTLRLVSRGMTEEDIARELGISPKTVGNHKRRIYAKLGVRTQTHAVATALRHGLLASGAGRAR
jgi:DNA-binding CsgD family transcriptional regulator